jgi:hypothetical protein
MPKKVKEKEKKKREKKKNTWYCSFMECAVKGGCN